MNIKKIKKLAFMCSILLLTPSCAANSEEESKTTTINPTQEIEVVYFHFSRRCATCIAVEKVSREAVKEIASEKIKFSEYNLNKKEGEAKAKTMGASGQTLLISTKTNKINITQEAFLNARNNPDKLKTIIKEKIASLK